MPLRDRRLTLSIAFLLSCSSWLPPLGGSTGEPASLQNLKTTAESSDFKSTSSYDDVVRFMKTVDEASPNVFYTTYGTTHEGRAMPLAVVGTGLKDGSAAAVRATGKLRVHIQGNVHAGEVEGKESAQILLRELALGRHSDWLQSTIFLITPIFNADGNEKMSLTNRGRQNGPINGMGTRANAQGLNINRDFMKLDTPEGRAFVKLWVDYDPHVGVDLHTSNGSNHAYFLTYSPPLHPNTSDRIMTLMKNEWFPFVTKNVKAKHGWDTFYYGNASSPGGRGGGGRGRGGAPPAGTPAPAPPQPAGPRAWATFEHGPRFHNNYVGLRNRFALLSEAYSYATFEDRIKATNYFLEEAMAFAHQHAARLKQTIVDADRERIPGTAQATRAQMRRGETIEILMGEVEEEKNPNNGAPMNRRKDFVRPEPMIDMLWFDATTKENVAPEYYVPAAATKALDLLRAHGIQVQPVRQAVRDVEQFAIDSNTATQTFEGHTMRRLEGAWKAAGDVTVPVGSWAVPMTQPLARLAFTLLEPMSDDGLVNWNLLDDLLQDAKTYPILRKSGQPLRGDASFDVILRRGTIVDGTGGRPYQADVGIDADSIARIGNLAGQTATTEIDVNGLYVSPGFINLHSHASALALASAENMLTQGVTTEILNPDGGGPVDIGAQLDRVGTAGLAVNVGAYIGFNSVWSSVVGDGDRRPTPEDIERMRQLLVTGLEKGAWGVSAGLDYKPAYFARTDEVITVVGAASKWRTNFPNHDRLTPETGFAAAVGVAETIRIGEQAGLVPVVTHMKSQGRSQRRAPELIDLMRKATKRGHYTAADVYPYLAGQTSLVALIIPGWAQDGGREALLKRFADPELRSRIVKEAEEAMAARFGGPEGVYLPGPRRELTDVMREMNVSGGEAVVRLLERQNMGVILRFGLEDDLVAIMRNPTSSIACDCGASAANMATHPRYYGTFPRVLGHYVRETKALTWEDAIRKMTGLPAATIGLVDRGFLAVGMAADITVFDPATVIDRATFESPTLPSEGIRHVLVNGRFALRDGKATGETAGSALVRTAHMPSRPLRVETARRSFKWTDPASSRVVQVKNFGVVQIADKWTSFTGRAHFPDGTERSVTVIVDDANPFAAEGGGVTIIHAEGGYQLTIPRRPAVSTSHAR